MKSEYKILAAEALIGKIETAKGERRALEQKRAQHQADADRAADIISKLDDQIKALEAAIKVIDEHVGDVAAAPSEPEPDPKTKPPAAKAK